MSRVGVDHPSSCGPVAIARLHEAPHVNKRLTTELELAIGAMWRAQDENVALRQDAIAPDPDRTGWYNRNGANVDASRLLRMTERIVHRGPDDRGICDEGRSVGASRPELL
jgi:hypothetical protein